MKFWGMTVHCSDVGKPAEPKPQQFKCDIFFSLEMLGIYVAIYLFKLFPFSWKGRKIVKFYCCTEGITSALRGNNTAIKEPSRVHQGSRKVHWNNSSPSLHGFKRMSSGALEESEPMREGRKTRILTFQRLEFSFPENPQNILKVEVLIAAGDIILLSLIPEYSS